MARRNRLDTELVRRGLARSREHAAELVEQGRVEVRGAPATKPAAMVDPADPVRVVAAEGEEFASRGGHKLAGALAEFAERGLAVAGRRCLDAGASTGGFTDLLLRRGAAPVVAVDVGYGQLAWALRNDARVTVMERTNVRSLTPEAIGGPVDLTVADLSFISLRLVLPALAACTAPDGDLVPMVKPQFEVGKRPGRRGRGRARPAAAGAGGARRGRGRVRAGSRRGRRGPQPAARAVGQRRVLPVAAPRGAAGRRGGRSPADDRRRIMTRTALLVTHTGRRDSTEHARTVARDLIQAGFTVRVVEHEAGDLGLPGVEPAAGPTAAEGAELVFALGGDGTFLRAAELARPAGVPLLGINLGKVGFLAEAEIADLDAAVRQGGRPGVHSGGAAHRRRRRRARTGSVVARSWALNEASVEKGARERMLELRVDVDGRPLSRYGCDGVVCATPTGSTAYAFSAGGPVVWPGVEALLLVPISAHALFSRALVVSPSSQITVTVEPNASAVLFCDGRRVFDVPAGAVLTVRRGELPVRVARLHPRPFTDRLVAKFGLPVEGWRTNSHEDHR